MMNFGNKAAFSIPKTNLFQHQVALFHSSPVLERRRRSFFDASHRSNNRTKNYSRRSRRLNANEALLRNIGAYADHLFQLGLRRIVEPIEGERRRVTIFIGCTTSCYSFFLVEKAKKVGLVTKGEGKIKVVVVAKMMFFGWNLSHRSNNYSRRSNRLNAKEALLCNISSYADHLFQSWHDGFDEEDLSSSSGPSWFRQQYTKGSRRGMNDNQRTTSSSKSTYHEIFTFWCGEAFHFCEDDDVDVDNIFRSTFGGNRYFHWSFTSDGNPQWKNSSGYYSYSYGKNQRYRVEEDHDCSSESDYDGLESNFASDRLALGLRAYGPLKLEDVKNAYRSCALKWHPDRHQGSSKAVAEEKFKLCSAAYQSLCDKLTAA
ncbi:hypothetical protein SADUNF_Sadunf16G0040800 [Salix dunnii]|uniref:J domain-containing protein n=1 Tax=Salix dunnii TaxID=1413687 RepID=A0A835MFY9_9ROSI|nr:hypothetical protein SADUNF_Sadunf16G0040800 [Salix dunnii]